MPTDLTYAEAQQELEAILAQLQQTPADIDRLRERVARAQELIDFCGRQLRGVEGDLDDLLKKTS